jgi:hypothetical protein
VRSVPGAEPDEHGHEERREPEHVVDREELNDGSDELLQVVLVEQVEIPLEVDQSRRVSDRLVGIADRKAANCEVRRVERGPEGEFDECEAAGCTEDARAQAVRLESLGEREADHASTLSSHAWADIGASP